MENFWKRNILSSLQPFLSRNLFPAFFFLSMKFRKYKICCILQASSRKKVVQVFLNQMTSNKQLEIQFEDPNPQKWCHALKEDVFSTFMNRENSTVQKIFGSRSFFGPLLFGKFFDPSDAFPLWEFDSDVLLASPNGSGQRPVDWFQTEVDFVLKAELPVSGNSMVQVCIINGEILEISGQWRQQRESGTRDWKSSHWWEHGFVRRIELPDETDWRRAEAHVKNDVFLEIRIPKKSQDCEVP